MTEDQVKATPETPPADATNQEEPQFEDNQTNSASGSRQAEEEEHEQVVINNHDLIGVEGILKDRQQRRPSQPESE